MQARIGRAEKRNVFRQALQNPPRRLRIGDGDGQNGLPPHRFSECGRVFLPLPSTAQWPDVKDEIAEKPNLLSNITKRTPLTVEKQGSLMAGGVNSR